MAPARASEGTPSAIRSVTCCGNRPGSSGRVSCEIAPGLRGRPAPGRQPPCRSSGLRAWSSVSCTWRLRGERAILISATFVARGSDITIRRTVAPLAELERIVCRPCGALVDFWTGAPVPRQTWRPPRGSTAPVLERALRFGDKKETEKSECARVRESARPRAPGRVTAREGRRHALPANQPATAAKSGRWGARPPRSWLPTGAGWRARRWDWRVRGRSARDRLVQPRRSHGEVEYAARGR